MRFEPAAPFCLKFGAYSLLDENGWPKFMSSQKPVKVFLLIIAVIFVVLSVGNIILRIESCLQIERPVAPLTEYSSENDETAWIGYKKFCRNPVPYIILILSGGYLASAINNFRKKYN